MPRGRPPKIPATRHTRSSDSPVDGTKKDGASSSRSPGSVIFGDFVGHTLNSSVLLSGPSSQSSDSSSISVASPVVIPESVSVIIPESVVVPEPTPAPGASKKPYVQTLKSSGKGMPLSYVRECYAKEVIIEADDIVDEVDYWSTTLVGTVMGRKTSIAELEGLVSKHWNHVTSHEILYFSRGWYYFRFYTKEDMESIQSEAWNLNGYPLVFKDWSPTVAGELDAVTHVPVWVLYPNLDPCFWSSSALSKVASFVGRPICADETTTCKTKIAFARILVEVDISKELPRTFHKMGYTKDHCKKNKVKQVYRPKVVPSPAAIEVGNASSMDSEGFIAVSSKKVSKTPLQNNVISWTGNRFVVLENAAPVLLQLGVDEGIVHVGFEVGNIPVEIEPGSFRISWNVRGMNDPLKQQEVLEFLRKNKVDCGAIIETHIKSNHINTVKRRCFSRYSLVTNLESHSRGKIWVLWDPAVVALRVLSQGAQFLHCSLLHLPSHCFFLVTFVYALNRASERLELWDSLRSFSTGSLPWICLGDFNVSLTSDERVGCVVHEREMLEFRECLRDFSLEDHPYTSGVFTWHNKQESCPKWAKLDRILANQQWFLQFPSTVAFLPPGISDMLLFFSLLHPLLLFIGHSDISTVGLCLLTSMAKYLLIGRFLCLEGRFSPSFLSLGDCVGSLNLFI
ncbi:hypothetical protein RND81_05G134400 [Saponaria officinalis]|uniref:DUF4283 domain-containing protein n=1 Tax=Saponaria officinalis TaxID=3572 RepID=A0AAW1L0J9_SAPOF